jgi:hypothetical protein
LERVRSVAEPQRYPPQPEEWLGQSAAAQPYQEWAQMVTAWVSLALQETVRRQESRWLASLAHSAAVQRKRPQAVLPVRPVAVACSYPEQLQMAAR